MEVQAVDVTGQYGSERVHDAGPLEHQLLPVAERGQHSQQLVPQLTGDKYGQVGPHPRHKDRLQMTEAHSSNNLTTTSNHIIIRSNNNQVLYNILQQVL